MISLKKLRTCIKADFLFQLKHGFYYIYIILAVFYIVLLSFFDENIVKILLPILIYSDPAALGLFFIGGMVLLEKEQGILSLLYITPLTTSEYIISKLFSLGVISILSATAISFVAYSGSTNYALLAVGILLTSIFFTLIGFIISAKAKSVNDYMVKIIPVMIIIILPCLSLIPNSFIPRDFTYVLSIIPSVSGLKLAIGAYSHYSQITIFEIVLSIISLLISNVLLIIVAKNILTDKVILDN